MRHPRLLAGAGLTALLVSLVALLPARLGFSLLGVPPAAASGLAGTVWRGSAQSLSLGGRTLGPVRWTAKPLRLLVGQLAAVIDGTLPDGFLNGTVAVGLGGKVALTDLEAAAPLTWLMPGSGMGGGQVSARFERLTVANGHIVAAVGNLKLGGIVLPLPAAGQQLGPGTYSVAFDSADLGPDDPLTGTLSDAGGPVEIGGTVKITPPTSYELTGTAKPRPDAPPELRNALQMLGPAAPDGKHELSLAGSF
jgi:hypothetical protein